MADKGYPVSQYVIRPLAEYDITNDPEVSQTRRGWNRAFSAQRIVVEHAFGQLKGRFPFLNLVPGWNLSQIYRPIEALLVIHNICVDLRDGVEGVDGMDAAVDHQLGGAVDAFP
ncbi:hypothetical protein FRC08_006030 [Ceratobasidium sp. 394]|nr:hypothetical protein FRC08_006030 [Ceratobasidium sp. 394]KAG9098681.1 hypothetical protein FS749_003248 [Ceratobasidium sp. UAMH 11750]